MQSWNEHFFVLTGTHLYYTEEQQQDINDGDDVPADDNEVGYDVPASCLDFAAVL